MAINLQGRIYCISGRWKDGNTHHPTVLKKKDVHDTLIKEIVDLNLGVELIVL